MSARVASGGERRARARVGYTYILVSGDQFAHVARRVFVEFLVAAKNEDGNIDGAQDRELVRLLEQAAFALQKGAAHARVSSSQANPRGRRRPQQRMRGGRGGGLHRAIPVILDGFDLNLSPPHLECSSRQRLRGWRDGGGGRKKNNRPEAPRLEGDAGLEMEGRWEEAGRRTYVVVLVVEMARVQ